MISEMLWNKYISLIRQTTILEPHSRFIYAVTNNTNVNIVQWTESNDWLTNVVKEKRWMWTWTCSPDVTGAGDVRLLRFSMSRLLQLPYPTRIIITKNLRNYYAVKKKKELWYPWTQSLYRQRAGGLVALLNWCKSVHDSVSQHTDSAWHRVYFPGVVASLPLARLQTEAVAM